VAGLKKRQRIRMIVVGLTLLAAAAVVTGYGLRKGIELFRSPSQVAEHRPPDGERFQLGGLVKEGSWISGPVHQFVITDLAAEVPVRFEGIVPDLFREGQGTIVKGALMRGYFVADEVLAKHDEKYMPREVVDALKEQGVWQPPE
jgi:cytochrome c-type biogenesis protein CcmE